MINRFIISVKSIILQTDLYTWHPGTDTTTKGVSEREHGKRNMCLRCEELIIVNEKQLNKRLRKIITYIVDTSLYCDPSKILLIKSCRGHF